MSLPEVLLWNGLRGRRLGGLLFRRQHPVGPYVLDFYCPSARLAVEVDGGAHDHPDQVRRDAARDEFLVARGIRVLRLPATIVLRDMDAAGRAIEAAAQGEG
jgi:very-short-patch-repair endonuclease